MSEEDLLRFRDSDRPVEGRVFVQEKPRSTWTEMSRGERKRESEKEKERKRKKEREKKRKKERERACAYECKSK